MLADTLGAGRDDRSLEELVLELYEKLQSHASPEDWLARMSDAVRQRAPAENDNYTAVCVKLVEETTVILPARGHDPAVSD